MTYVASVGEARDRVSGVGMIVRGRASRVLGSWTSHTSRMLSIHEWYSAFARVKKRGRWRFPLWACAAIFIFLSPLIILVGGLAALPIGRLALDGLVHPLLGLAAMAVCVLGVAGVLAQLIYFGLRKPAPEDNGPQCRKCSYNLTGNVSGVCPECGTAIGQP